MPLPPLDCRRATRPNTARRRSIRSSSSATCILALVTAIGFYSCCMCPTSAFMASKAQPQPTIPVPVPTRNGWTRLLAVQTETEVRTSTKQQQQQPPPSSTPANDDIDIERDSSHPLEELLQRQRQRRHHSERAASRRPGVDGRTSNNNNNSHRNRNNLNHVFQEMAERIEIRCDTNTASSDDASENVHNNNNNQSSQESSEKAANDAANESRNADDSNDDDDDALAQRRNMAARAALLGHRVGSPPRGATASTSRATSTKQKTSVGARRTGSATKARQGPGMTQRIMDAVRKSASVPPTTTTSDGGNNNEQDNNKENHSTDNNAKASVSTPAPRRVQPKLPVSGIHAAVVELMERQRKDRRPAPETVVPKENEEELPLVVFPQKRLEPRPPMVPPAGTMLIPASPSTTDAIRTTSNNNNRGKLLFPDCLTVRVATPRCDMDIANLRLSVFSDFTPEVRRSLIPRSVKAVVTRRHQGATCLIATVPKPVLLSSNDAAQTSCREQPQSNHHQHRRPPVILGSAECSFHEFQGTTLGQRRLPQSILYITEVAVSPIARRRGIGAKLLEAVDVLAKMRGIETVYLHVDVENEGALALYETAGYQILDKTEPMFLEFTTKLALHDGATKGRNHYLLSKDLVDCPTWLPAETSATVSGHCSSSSEVIASNFASQGAAGTLGFEVPC